MLTVALLAGALAATALSVGDGDSTTTYTATVKYYDSVMITYTLNYPTGGMWTGGSDIPIGGIAPSDPNKSGSTDNPYHIGQIYCVDPFVAFHLKAVTDWLGPSVNGWGTTTTDMVDGYVAAAPWAMSAAMRRNIDAVRWLALNGYRGDFRYNDQESKDSVTRLENMYGVFKGISNIKGNEEKVFSRIVALMATKIAIWKVLTKDTPGALTDIKTSLDGSAYTDAVYKLVDDLVSDAIALRSNKDTCKMTSFSMSIKSENPELDDKTNDGFVYYGPFTVTASLSNPGGAPLALDKVFLTAIGPEAEGVTFVLSNEPGEYEILPISGTAEKIYGTGTQAPYLTKDDFTEDGGKLVSSGFYLKIPDIRSESTKYNIKAASDKLTIQAMGKAPDVEVVGGTPVVFVFGDGGIQNWNEVQAFIGAASDGMKVDLYAEDSLTTGETVVGNLYVSKTLENSMPGDDEKVFNFRINYSADSSETNPQVLDLKHHPVHGAFSVDYDKDTFTLKNGGLALIENLPVSNTYWVEEVAPFPDEYSKPDYEIAIIKDDDIERTGRENTTGDQNAWRTGNFEIESDDSGEAIVSFYNIKTPDTPGEPIKPEKPEDPEIPETPKSATPIMKISKFGMIAKDGFFSSEILLEKPFKFILEYLNDKGEWTPVDLKNSVYDIFIGESQLPKEEDGITNVADPTKGEFVLYSFETAIIAVMPSAHYRVIENYPGTSGEYGNGWWTAYAITCDVNGNISYIPDTVDPRVRETIPFFEIDKIEARITEPIFVEAGGVYQVKFTNMVTDFHTLKISKTVAPESAARADKDKLYPFSIYPVEPVDTDENPKPIGLSAVSGVFDAWHVRIAGANGDPIDEEIVAARHGVGSAGSSRIFYTLYLKDGETATVYSMFEGAYEIVEALGEDSGRYTTTYRVSTGGKTAPRVGSSTAMLTINGDTQVSFTNTLITRSGPSGKNVTPVTKDAPEDEKAVDTPDDGDAPEETEAPEETGAAEESDLQGAPDGADVVTLLRAQDGGDDSTNLGDGGTPRRGLSAQTGDERDPLPTIIALALGFGCIVAARIYRKRANL